MEGFTVLLTSFCFLFWSNRARSFDCRLRPHDGDNMGVPPGLRGVKNLPRADRVNSAPKCKGVHSTCTKIRGKAVTAVRFQNYVSDVVWHVRMEKPGKSEVLMEGFDGIC